MTKNEIRTYQRNQRNTLTIQELTILGTEIRNRLFETKAYRSCKRLFTFVSFQSEVDTQEIIKQAIKTGREVYIPRVEAHGLEFYRITGLEGLLPSKFGVLEPQQLEADRFDLDKAVGNRADIINLMLLPGLAFDIEGNRIGYGAGYYDRYLASHNPSGFHKIAVAYDFQVLEHIPAEPFDIKADVIITPTRYIECRSKA